MDRIEAMAMLLEVVDKGGFSAASRTLRVPVTTVSRRISDLEARLGAKLLARSTRRVALTEAGHDYVAAARRILDDLDEAERAAAGEFIAPRGELVVTAPILFGQFHLVPVVADFLALYPQIDVRLILLDRNVQLAENHVDMAVRIGSLPDSSMVATKVGTTRMVVCASPSLLARLGTPGAPEDLSHLPCVTFDGPWPTPAWSFRGKQGRSPVEVPVNSRLSVTTAQAAVDAAIQGVGLTRLFHYQVADALSQGQLRLLLERHEPEPVPISVIHNSRGRLPLKMRCFLDFAVPRLRSAVARLNAGQRGA